MKVRTNNSNSKLSVNQSITLNVDLKRKEKIYVDGDINNTVNAYDVYLSERQKTGKVRLTCEINPICSNILFNPVTEIVKNEGSDNTISLNYTPVYNKDVSSNNGSHPIKPISIPDGKFDNDSFQWTAKEAIRDTQLSSSQYGFTYHCGIDIFNNHLLRSNIFKIIGYNSLNSYRKYEQNERYFGFDNRPPSKTYIDENFNTIDDWLRGSDGKIIFSLKYRGKRRVDSPLHMYQSSDARTFQEAIDDRLSESNGWFGFYNLAKLPTYDNNMNIRRKIDISKPINSAIGGTFIDMYPGRDLYSFTPKFNPYRRRLEKNWDYCITYPSSSTTNGIYCIDSVTKGLKIYVFDDDVVNDNGENVISFYTVSQHGLQVGDYVNIYSTNDNNQKLIIYYALVTFVGDKYSFQITKGNHILSNQWYENTSGLTRQFTVSDTTYTRSSVGEDAYRDSNNVFYPVVPGKNKVNLDKSFLNLSFKRVVGGVECEYYARIFSRLPNFKFANENVNFNNLYKKGNTLISDYSDNNHNFESHLNSLGFSKNIYGDNISEIVFTDDIDISSLVDNLGRPLTDIYLTIVKRNKGYKKWYGLNRKPQVAGSDIEYSHCFGKNTCGIMFSDSIKYRAGVPDVTMIHAGSRQGLSMANINHLSFDNGIDEIDFDSCKNFYGDICCYSPTDADETVIQPVMNRFNTAQRELQQHWKSYQNFANIQVDELIESNDEDSDTVFTRSPSDDNKSHSSAITYSVLARPEGYYYQPHYKIPVKTVSSKLSSTDSDIYDVLAITYMGNDTSSVSILLKSPIHATLNSKICLYKKDSNIVYKCQLDNIIGSRKFICHLTGENGKAVTIPDISNVSNFIVVIATDDVPFYATLARDGSCKYQWREILQNGTDPNSNVEIYPFANGALYINRLINFYLRRQDPHSENNLTITNGTTTDGMQQISYEPQGEEIADENNDSYVNQKNMKEC